MRATLNQPQLRLPKDIVAAMSDDAWFGKHFAGPSWDRWRACLRAAFALPMSADDLALFNEVAEREPPTQRIRELWCIIGRRGGKDSVASLIATYVAVFGNFASRLRPGEHAVVAIIAVDRQQARICWRFINALFDNPILKTLVTRRMENSANLTVELSNGVDIEILSNNFRSVRGRTLACVIMDECAFWRDESGANPDVEVYNAVLPGLSTLPGNLLIGISTAYRKAGLLYSKFSEHYGKDDDETLVIRGPSKSFNPLLDDKLIQRAIARDPEVANAEWLSIWRSDIGEFLGRAIIENAVDRDVIVRAPVDGTKYYAFADPSGGISDSFTLAIAHREAENVAVLDSLTEWKSPFNPSAVVAEAADILHSYKLSTVKSDRYAANWVTEAWRTHQIKCIASELDRSALYENVIPLFASGRARILDNERLVQQFHGLERRTRAGGRDRIDHTSGAKDDLANSCAGALTMAVARKTAIVIDEDFLRKSMIPNYGDRFLNRDIPTYL
jgi:hypothetical protein